jgi:hypothetical protein
MNAAGGGVGMWDEADGFFYDVLHLSDGPSARAAQGPLDGRVAAALRRHGLRRRFRERYPRRRSSSAASSPPIPELVEAIHLPRDAGVEGRRLPLS